MRYTFHFPDIGEGIAEGKIVEWYVEVGQTVKSGDPVVKMETDKVVDDIPSPRDGKVVERFGSVDDVINVDDPLIVIEIEGEEAEAAAPGDQGVVGQIEIADDSNIMPPSSEGFPVEREKEQSRPKRTLATPVARGMAKELGVDINEVQGTGPDGRITKKDILAYYKLHLAAEEEKETKFTPDETMPEPAMEKEAPPPLYRPVKPAGEDAPNVAYEPLSQIRKAIARQMVISKQTAPHMAVFEEVEISKLINFRREQKEKFAEMGCKLTYMPFILKAVVASLKKHKTLNSEMDEENDRLIYKFDYHIGIAVDAPDGLVVPVIRDVDKLSFYELARQVSELSDRARERKLTLTELKGGTFSITNFGAIAGIYGVPIINYPQVAILGIGRIMKVPIVNEDDEIVPGHILPISASVDHRVVDGGHITRFLKDVCDLLADPMKLLMM